MLRTAQKVTDRESEKMEITYAEYITNGEQSAKTGYCVDAGSVAEWSKALVSGTSHSMAWLRILRLPIAFY